MKQLLWNFYVLKIGKLGSIKKISKFLLGLLKLYQVCRKLVLKFEFFCFRASVRTIRLQSRIIIWRLPRTVVRTTYGLPWPTRPWPTSFSSRSPWPTTWSSRPPRSCPTRTGTAWKPSWFRIIWFDVFWERLWFFLQAIMLAINLWLFNPIRNLEAILCTFRRNFVVAFVFLFCSNFHWPFEVLVQRRRTYSK